VTEYGRALSNSAKSPGLSLTSRSSWLPYAVPVMCSAIR